MLANRKTRRRANKLGRSRGHRKLEQEAKRQDTLLQIDLQRIVKGKPAKYLLRNEDPAEVLREVRAIMRSQHADEA